MVGSGLRYRFLLNIRPLAKVLLATEITEKKSFKRVSSNSSVRSLARPATSPRAEQVGGQVCGYLCKKSIKWKQAAMQPVDAISKTSGLAKTLGTLVFDLDNAT
jgi:hypothetical protein